MKLPFIQRLIQTRRFLHTLDRIAVAQERQADLLSRLADHFCPIIEPGDLQTTGPSYSRDVEQRAISEFTAQIRRDHGRLPTEEELVALLDEKFPSTRGGTY